MLKKLLIGLLASASLSVGAIAADKVDFEKGSDAKTTVKTIQSETDEISAPDTVFQVSTGKTIHAKGFVRKDLPNAAWKSFKHVKVTVPNTMDLRSKLTQVENQGSCGSCWAFSLTATHRDGNALGGTDPGRLSQEWLVDNSTYAAGCQGGYFDSASDFVTPGGQPLWSACPYKSGSGKCAATLPKAAHITGWYMLGEKGTGPTIQDIEAYMTLSGKEISIGVAAAAGSWESYSSGIYKGCTTGQLDHMINIVGWDNEGATFDANGNLPAGKGVWILRNSWGASWGEKGYMRTKMTDAKGVRCNAVAEEAAAFDFQ